jgi:hypothetical protein
LPWSVERQGSPKKAVKQLDWSIIESSAQKHRLSHCVDNRKMKNRMPSVLYLYLLLSATTATASNFLSIRQQSSVSNATISLVDSSDGSIVATSTLSFAYKRPSIEATATDDSNYYIVGFPTDDPNGAAHLWELTSKLIVKNEWVQSENGLVFFDLQYSSIQSQLFGIAVNGTYGRVISRLDISGEEVTAEFMVACPYMWSVSCISSLSVTLSPFSFSTVS